MRTKSHCFDKAVLKSKRILAILLSVAVTLIIPAVTHAQTYSGNRSIDGFSVSYNTTVGSSNSYAEMSCSGSSNQNPKPLTIAGSIRIRLYGSDEIWYLSFTNTSEVEYGEPLFVSNSLSTPSGVSIDLGRTIYSFLGTPWTLSYYH